MTPSARHRTCAVLVLTAALVALPAATAGGELAATADAPDVGGVWSERRVLNIAHAGGDLEAPHSTPYAFAQAVRNGADVLEMDVMLSADGVPMVHHDTTVDRITNASGRLDSFTAAELHELDAGYWFVPNCWSCRSLPAEEYRYRGVRTGDVPPPEGFGPDDFVIPTLRWVLETYPDRVLDIEIKGSYPAALPNADAVADLLVEFGRTDDVVVASFDSDVIAAFKERLPDVPTSPGVDEMLEWFFDRRPMPEHAVVQVPRYFDGVEVVTPQFVADAHAAGVGVWVYFSGNSQEHHAFYAELLDMGVDGLITGKPGLLQELLVERDDAFAVPFTTPVDSVRALAPTVGVPLACGAVAVAPCDGYFVAAARAWPGGPALLLGHGAVTAPAGGSATVELRLPRWTRLQVLLTGGVDARIVVWPRPHDTALSDLTVRLARR